MWKLIVYLLVTSFSPGFSALSIYSSGVVRKNQALATHEIHCCFKDFHGIC